MPNTAVFIFSQRFPRGSLSNVPWQTHCNLSHAQDQETCLCFILLRKHFFALILRGEKKPFGHLPHETHLIFMCPKNIMKIVCAWHQHHQEVLTQSQSTSVCSYFWWSARGFPVILLASEIKNVSVWGSRFCWQYWLLSLECFPFFLSVLCIINSYWN